MTKYLGNTKLGVPLGQRNPRQDKDLKIGKWGWWMAQWVYVFAVEAK